MLTVKWKGMMFLTCTLLPPIPKELMLILSRRSGGNGVGVTGTLKLYLEKGTRYPCYLL
jgi:hypothetical protein